MAGNFRNLIPYSYVAQTIKNLHLQQVQCFLYFVMIKKLAQTKCNYPNFYTALMWNGTVYGQSADGYLRDIVLNSHDALNLSIFIISEAY